MFWRMRDRFSADTRLDVKSEGFYAAARRQLRRDDRSILKYVTVASEGSQRRSGVKDTGRSTKNLPGGTSAVVPPDPMPNSEVKRRSADGSVGSPHVRVGHRQASK